MSKLAAFQFYPGDWLKDPALSICSPGARGVWIDVLCLMFESPRRGYLITNGKPWTLEQLSEALRGHPSANLLFLKELVRNGVIREDKKRGYFSARMARDEHQRELWRGEKRRQLIKNKGSHSGTHSANLPPVLHSSSSSSNLTTRTPLTPLGGGNGLSHDDLLKDKRNYGIIAWREGESIVIRTNGKRRVFTRRQEEDLSICGIVENAIEKIRGWGYWAERYVPVKHEEPPA